MTKLETITAEDLQNRTYEPTHFLVDELIPEGLHILAGAPKIGKSWLALWLCLCVAQGQALWNFATTQGEALYLSLEDSFQRIQTRLFDLTEDAPPTLHFAIMADTLKHGLEQQIEQFLTDHPDTKLVVIDTLQRVRHNGKSQRCANVQRTKSQSSNAIAILRGGAAEWTRPAACGGARDMELVPTKEPASHLASRRRTGSLPNASNRAEARTHFYERRKDEKRQTI